MNIVVDDRAYLDDFVRLNEDWISQFFGLTKEDEELASNPYKIVDDGGHILCFLEDGKVVGACALMNEQRGLYQLARFAVDSSKRGNGYGDALMLACLKKLREKEARSVYLYSNKELVPAIFLYKKYGFVTVSEGIMPDCTRANIKMERPVEDE